MPPPPPPRIAAARQALVLALTLACLAAAQHLDVYVDANPPFTTASFDSEGKLVLVGYEIDLWNAVQESLSATNASSTFTFHLTPFNSIFNHTLSEPNAVGLASITMTAQRERLYGQFTIPYFNSGLNVLVRRRVDKTNLFLFFAPFSIWLWLSIIVTLYFSGHVIWFMERNYQPVHFPRTYLRGVNEGVWFCWGILTGTCSKDLLGFPSRMYSVGWSILSVVFVAAYTANLATILTVEQLRSDITSYQQLGGKHVAAIAGTTGAAFVLRNLPNAILVLFPSTDAAFVALQTGVVDAFIHDGPTLTFLQATMDLSDALELLGSTLTKEDYGMLVHKSARPLVLQLNDILLELHDSGMADALHRKWFNYASSERSSALISENPQALTFFAISGMYITLAVSLACSILAYLMCRVKKWL